MSTISGGTRQRVPPEPYDQGVSSHSAPAPVSPIPVRAVAAVDRARLTETCRRWRIAELDVFGSVARGEEGPGSDIDLLVTFLPGTEWGLFDHVAIEDDLSGLFGRRVDLATRRAVERSGNALRREEILSTARPVHVS